MTRKADCYKCAHKRRKKDFVQQKSCELGLERKNCTKFVDYVEWQKYQEIMNEQRTKN